MFNSKQSFGVTNIITYKDIVTRISRALYLVKLVSNVQCYLPLLKNKSLFITLFRNLKLS